MAKATLSLADLLPFKAVFAGDAPDQLLQRIGIFLAEIDLLESFKQNRELRRAFAARQDHGDNRRFALHELTNEGFHFQVLPGTNPPGANENRRRLDVLELRLQCIFLSRLLWQRKTS